MIELAPRRCRSHRAVLLDFVDRAERTPRLDAALDHLAGCASCRRELEGAALTIAALRRLSRAVAAAEPPNDAWPRLRDRIRRRRRTAWSAPLQVGALVVSAWIVALGTGPMVIVTTASPPWVDPHDTTGGGSALAHPGDPRIRTLADPLDRVVSVRWVAPDGAGVRGNADRLHSTDTIRTVSRR